MHGLQESAMAPFNKGHLLSGGGVGVGYPVLIEINSAHTRFYGYGGICSIGAADAHETLSSRLAAVTQRHAVGYARKPSVVHLPSNLCLHGCHSMLLILMFVFCSGEEVMYSTYTLSHR